MENSSTGEGRVGAVRGTEIAIDQRQQFGVVAGDLRLLIQPPTTQIIGRHALAGGDG